MMTITPDNIELIKYLEAGNYNPTPEFPCPRNQNCPSTGVTIGYGYDLNQEDNFISDWTGLIPDSTINRLRPFIKIGGVSARNAISGLRDISIPQNAAEQVLVYKTLPAMANTIVAGWPNIGNLPPLVQGVILSLCYQRGTAYKTRPDMALVRQYVGAGELSLIASALRSMGLTHGYASRRNLEAKFVDYAINGKIS